MTGYHSGHFVAKNLSTNIDPSWAGPVLPRVLKEAGYATAGIGKLAPFSSPRLSGFDVFTGQIDQGLCHNMYPRTIDSGLLQNNINLTRNDKMPANATEARASTMANPSEFNYTVDITHQHSMAWLKNEGAKMRDPAKPFFLYEAFTVPHAGGWGWRGSPLGPSCRSACRQQLSGAPVPSDGQYAVHSDWPDVERDHAAVITYLDNYVGELVQTLKTTGVDESTLVFFASDNGAHLEGGHDYHFFNSTGGLLGHKRSLYEGTRSHTPRALSACSSPTHTHTPSPSPSPSPSPPPSPHTHTSPPLPC